MKRKIKHIKCSQCTRKFKTKCGLGAHMRMHARQDLGLYDWLGDKRKKVTPGQPIGFVEAFTPDGNAVVRLGGCAVGTSSGVDSAKIVKQHEKELHTRLMQEGYAYCHCCGKRLN